MKDYFENKNSNGFKNSKIFWSFYRSSIKIRNDFACDVCPEIIHDGENSANSISEQVEMFNKIEKSISELLNSSSPGYIVKLQNTRLEWLEWNGMNGTKRMEWNRMEWKWNGNGFLWNASPFHSFSGTDHFILARTIVPLQRDVCTKNQNSGIIPHLAL
ncbi:hypothetical protein BpHYR1_035878 [Brachionus plicatilis]|uniref:Uncharacterized protein n=1 Tax=Brachionus plicatilis TaxID=10195 RepID=A0A3M7QVQ8_BRAPC|nr:hypothetical protein BpHYR1_035878 [Brachionus plicatilis]